MTHGSKNTSGAGGETRRDFIKKGSSLLVAGGVVAGSLSIARGAHAFGSDVIKIGLEAMADIADEDAS